VSFHDAEVQALRLDREGPTLHLDVAVAFPELRIVHLRFERVTDVELDGFNEQNVLFDLKVVTANDGRLDVELQSSYGLGGSLRCASISEA
jgi:Immunity protein 50